MHHPRRAAPFDEFDFTDAQVAERFANEALVGNYIWTKELGWLAWDKKRWREIPAPAMIGVARRWIKDQYVLSAEMLAESRSERNKNLTNRARVIHSDWYSYQSFAKIIAVIKLAQPDVIHSIDEFDTKPDLLNVRNGVIDLRAGKLMPHDPELMLTRLADDDYIPGATHKDWTAALEAVPKDLRAWFQLRCGQSITGYKSDDDAVIFLKGGGANGKNTVMEAYLKTLGDYFQVASPKVWEGSINAHSTELADLYGARMVWMDELPKDNRLPAVRLKQLTSGQFSARKIGKNNMLIEVAYTMFVSTNYRPIVTETDEGTWRRLFLLNFPFRFRRHGEDLILKTDKRGDARLRQRLRDGRRQHEAILAWLVEGAKEWYAIGCKFSKPDPKLIEQARAEWRKDEDQIWRFIEEKIGFDPNAHVRSDILYQEYRCWVTEQGQQPWASPNFNKQFANHELVVPRNVIKKKTRRDPPNNELSEPGGVVNRSALPESYQAWFGIRFKEPELTIEY